MSPEDRTAKDAKRAAAKAAKFFDAIRDDGDAQIKAALAGFFEASQRDKARIRDLEAIANLAAEADPAVDAAIREAAHRVARMTEAERAEAAMPKLMREAFLASERPDPIPLDPAPAARGTAKDRSKPRTTPRKAGAGRRKTAKGNP
ncbi:hypothetical protein G3576_07875 [Roseomonas stagni]|uniref:Uncharacterized protein n=1 Tax=Falsiroseomonas algicola TaxID=2716930 RepID=A0A6M1LI17_9PROT|nr:histidinol dehydrogenase [Falsiroseomonas algicola]NGM19930.1 hypothetical protein [Falsiroseomonas algicola]